MSYYSLLRRAQKERVLFNVLLELTYNCNHYCTFCYNDKSSISGKLNLKLAQYINLLEELSLLGVMNLTISGGEPLLSPYFWEIGRIARKAGFVVRIKSNGYEVDQDVARRIKNEIAPFNIDLSLHGATAFTHDRQTQVEGSFDRLMHNIEVMQEVGLRIRLNSPLTSWNENEIEGMYELADRFSIPLYFDDRLTPKDDGDKSPLDLLSTEYGLKKLQTIWKNRFDAAKTDELISVKESEYQSDIEISNDAHCVCGLSNLVIDPYGTVFPCIQWRRPLGSIHHESISEIWNNSGVLKDIRKTTISVKEHLQQLGPDVKKAGFCPAIAEQMEEDATTIDIVTLRRIELLKERE